MYWRAGARVLPLAGFHASMATPDEARNLALWARTYGRGGSFWVGKPNPTPVSEIEFGNETSFTYQYGDAPGSNSYRSRAETYALRFKDAQAAIAAANPNVGLLAQADDGGTGSSEWVDRMFAAVPDLASRVAGWTVHPYGPAGRAADRLTRTVASTTAHGAPTALPLWITENGFATDNGRCLSDNYGWDRCMSYDQAGANLTSLVQTLRGRFPQIRAFLLYQARDQRDPGATGEREHYFGALTRTDGDKGGYTGAVRQLMAAH